MPITQRTAPPLAFLAAAVLLFCTGFAGGQGSAPTAAPVPWDTAFAGGSGTVPLHFTARYLDGRGQSHRLEEWRLGEQHLRRRTDDTIDLHADRIGQVVTGQPPDYVWQILDLQKHIAHRVSTAGMLHLGMLYSYYSMAHLLTRPTGKFTVQRASAPVPTVAGANALAVSPHLPPCTWWQIEAPGQTATRVCWLSRYGIPAQTWSKASDGWHLAFAVDSFDTRTVPASTFATDTTGFQIRNVDELEQED